LRDEFHLSDLWIEPLLLESIHYNFYCDSIAGYASCQKVNIDHTLVDPTILAKIDELKTVLVPIVKK
jgi:hypothetical protein